MVGRLQVCPASKATRKLAPFSCLPAVDVSATIDPPLTLIKRRARSCSSVRSLQEETWRGQKLCDGGCWTFYGFWSIVLRHGAVAMATRSPNPKTHGAQPNSLYSRPRQLELRNRMIFARCPCFLSFGPWG